MQPQNTARDNTATHESRPGVTEQRVNVRSQRGQAAVETAIVMPLFVFIMLGVLQLGLINQARVMTKYAAYKAARAGAIHNANGNVMEKAALVEVLPLAGRRLGGDSFFNASMTTFAASWVQAKLANGSFGSCGANKHVCVTICAPTSGTTGDFDDPEGGLAESTGASPDFGQFSKGHLAVQVTFFHQLVIPFANMMIWHIVAGREDADTMRTFRMNKRGGTTFSGRGTISQTVGLAALHQYVIPIRANWAMRMQSNFLGSSVTRLPGKNECKAQW
jgi:TadE-like protein